MLLYLFCFCYKYEKIGRKTVLKTMEVHKSLQVYKLNKLVQTISQYYYCFTLGGFNNGDEEGDDDEDVHDDYDDDELDEEELIKQMLAKEQQKLSEANSDEDNNDKEDKNASDDDKAQDVCSDSEDSPEFSEQNSLTSDSVDPKVMTTTASTKHTPSTTSSNTAKTPESQYPVSSSGRCPYCGSTDVKYIIVVSDNTHDTKLPPSLQMLLKGNHAFKMAKGEVNEICNHSRFASPKTS